MTESVKSITQHHEPLRIFIAAESADETGKMARTFCDASDIVVTGSATHAADVDAAFARECPADVLVCDVVLNGADMAPILERAKRTHPKLDILVVTACAQDAVVIRAVLAGATGYILKDSQENLLTSIRLLRGGGSPVSPTVARSVLRAIHARTITQPVPPKPDSAPPVRLVVLSISMRMMDECFSHSAKAKSSCCWPRAFLSLKSAAFLASLLIPSPPTSRKFIKSSAFIRAAKRSMKPPAWGLCRFNAAMLQRSRAATVAQQHVISASRQDRSQWPDLPPSFSKRQISVITMPRSTALSMS